MLGKLGPSAQLVAIDADPVAAMAARKIKDKRLSFFHSNFAELDQVLAECNAVSVDGVLMDLGMSSMQVDDPARGFSFASHGDLDMRMDTSSGRTLSQRLARVSQRELGEIIREYGEERHAKAIARRMINLREKGKLRTSADIASACGSGHAKRHAATRVFLALRIWVNDELGKLRIGLQKAAGALRTGGRLVVISFHSLEDRIVKRFIRPIGGDKGLLERVGKPIRPSAEEIGKNHRARSAIMRVAART